jgi:DNA primase
MYKCFGCGLSGGPITFVMAYNRLSFVDAIKELAQSHGIPVEYDNFTPEQQAEYEREYKEKKSLLILLEYATCFFEFNDIPKEFLKHRRIKDEAVKKFRLGFALPGKDTFYKHAKAGGYEDELLEKAGLIRRVEKDGKVLIFDVFQNRIMFPITNSRGEVIAFSGRLHE